MARARTAARKPTGLAKCPTGIRGFDEVTNGGLPRGRTTLVCGGAGCGKTLLAMEFLMRGIRDYGEPGAFMTFEENAEELAQNVASLGYDLKSMIKSRRLAVDHVRVERGEIEETGEYDLEGLFIRLGALIERTGAKRVAIDSIEALFAGIPNEAILRSELRRLFRWLKSKRVTAIITGEQGNGSLTRHGLEEYVSDCVIFLDHRVASQIATRRLRVIKYRGSSHGTNEYPTMIDEHGLSVLPISSLGLDYPVSKQRVSSGIPRLDAMLAGKGFYKGSSVLVSGTAGSGKSTIARTMFGDRLYRLSLWPAARAVVDCLGDRPIREITGVLTAVGFSSPPSWIKPYHALSTGEQFRCDLARALGEKNGAIDPERFEAWIHRILTNVCIAHG